MRNEALAPPPPAAPRRAAFAPVHALVQLGAFVGKELSEVRRQPKLILSLIVGFILFNLLVVGIFIGWLAINLDWVIGLFWFLGKAIGLSAFFVLMRGTLPRVRIDELMGFAWKWLVPAALLNIFVTAGAILVIKELNL